MKTRIIQTDFWNDEKIQNLGVFAQHLYIFLLTCPQINICGIFKLSKGLIKLMTRLTDGQFELAMQELEENNKAFFFNGWVFVKNARQKNGYEKSIKNKAACKKELNLIPNEVKDYFNSKLSTTNHSSTDTTIDTTIDSNHKSKIINHKPKGIVRGKKKKEVSDKENKFEKFNLNPDFVRNFAKSESLDEKVVFNKIPKWKDHHLAKRTAIYDYEASFRNWIRKAVDFGEIKPIKKQEKPKLILRPVQPNFKDEKRQGASQKFNKLRNSELGRKLGLKPRKT